MILSDRAQAQESAAVLIGALSILASLNRPSPAACKPVCASVNVPSHQCAQVAGDFSPASLNRNEPSLHQDDDALLLMDEPDLQTINDELATLQTGQQENDDGTSTEGG